MYLWWRLWCTLYLVARKVIVTVGDSGLCCCIPCNMCEVCQALLIPFVCWFYCCNKKTSVMAISSGSLLPRDNMTFDWTIIKQYSHSHPSVVIHEVLHNHCFRRELHLPWKLHPVTQMPACSGCQQKQVPFCVASGRHQAVVQETAKNNKIIHAGIAVHLYTQKRTKTQSELAA